MYIYLPTELTKNIVAEFLKSLYTDTFSISKYKILLSIQFFYFRSFLRYVNEIRLLAISNTVYILPIWMITDKKVRT